MTREEALRHFKEQLDIFGGEHAEAIKVAIEALKSYSKDSDLISREAAKDIAFRSPFFSDALMEELEALPSDDRPRGEWIETGKNKDGTHNIRCDQCGESFKARGHANSYNTKKKYRFCPSCGADMRGERE